MTEGRKLELQSIPISEFYCKTRNNNTEAYDQFLSQNHFHKKKKAASACMIRYIKQCRLYIITLGFKSSTI